MSKSKKRTGHKGRSNSPSESSPAATKGSSVKSADSGSADALSRAWPVLLAFAAAVFVWSYWPVLTFLVGEWTRVPDYSHGFIVLPLAAWFLWTTRESFPGIQRGISWGGLVLILIAAALRWAGSYYYLEALHGWSIPFWIGGVVWLFLGWPAFRWAAPALGFLIFMVPLPYTIENMLAVPLQRASTAISLFVLQCLGQPAIGQGTTILIAGVEQPLEVARACSGIRIFFGIAGLCYAFLVLFQRPWGTRLILIASIVPIALAANSLRIVSLGLLRRMNLNETGDLLAHDMAGVLMIPVAAALFFLLLKYLDALFPMVESVDAGHLIRRQRTRATS